MLKHQRSRIIIHTQILLCDKSIDTLIYNYIVTLYINCTKTDELSNHASKLTEIGQLNK